MKHILLSIFGLLSVVSAYSQRPVADFFSAMTSPPVGKKVYVMDVVYDNNAYSGLEEKSIRWRKPWESTRNGYAKMGQIVDSLNLIDYKADTIYVYSQGDLMRSSVSETFKVGDSHFSFYKDRTGGYSIKFYDGEYDSSTDPRMIASDSLFFDTIFVWDIEQFIRMIKASGGFEATDYYYYATRIILQDNRVIKKDIINFRQVML